MTVVVGAVVWIAGTRTPDWTVSKGPFWRDILSLLVAVSVVLKVAHDGKIEFWEAMGFLVLWVVYIAIVLLPKLKRYCKPLLGLVGPAITTPKAAASGRPTSSTHGMHEAFLDPFVAGTADTPTSNLGPLRGVTSNAGGGALPPLVASPMATPLSADEFSSLPVSRATVAVEPLQLEPRFNQSVNQGPNGRVHAGMSDGYTNPFAPGQRSDTTDSQRLQWLWGEWGEGGGPVPGGSSGGGGGGEAPMPGLDYPEAGSSKLAIAMWAFEWPLSVLRWLSIPSSDGEWSRKRRLWTAATPPMASLVFATGLLFDGEAPSYSPFVATMLGSVGGGEGGFPNMVLVMLLSTSLCPLLYLLSVDNKPPRFQAGLVVCGFAMTIVWLKIIASEMIALIETFGHLFGVSTSILGLTVIAIGNSIGDFVADTAAAREGTVSGTRMAIAATFGSPVIMNIVSVGLSFTLRLAITGFQPICFASVSLVTRLGYILFYVTIFSHLAVFPLCGYKAPRAYAVYLFGIYGLLLLLSCLIEVGGIDGSGLCGGLSQWLFDECDRPKPAECSA